MNTGSFDTGGAILPALAAFFSAPTLQAHPPIVVTNELMFAPRHSASPGPGANLRDSGNGNGMKMISEFGRNLSQGVKINCSGNFVVTPIFAGAGQGPFGKEVSTVITIPIIFVVLSNGFLFCSVGGCLVDFANGRKAFFPPKTPILGFVTVMQMRSPEGRDNSLAVRDDHRMVMPFLREAPKGDVYGKMLRRDSRLRTIPGNLAISNILSAVLSGLESGTSRHRNGLNTNALGRAISVDRDSGIKFEVLKIHLKAVDEGR
jgi:hypothetical protein